MGQTELVDHPGLRHPSVLVEHGDWSAEIDEGLAELVLEIWRAGIETVDCCQAPDETMAYLLDLLPGLEQRQAAMIGRAMIAFPDYSIGRFFDAMANSGPRDAFYLRMVHWCAAGAWTVLTAMDDDASDVMSDEDVPPVPSSFALSYRVVVEFPRSDIAEMTRRMRVWNAGDLPEPGPIDWSTIELDL